VSTEAPPGGGSVSVVAGAASVDRGLRGDTLLMVGAKLCVIVFGAGTTVIVARSLGPAGRGSLAAIFALIALLVQLGTFGIVAANPYFVAREPHLRAGIAGNSLWLAGVLGPVMAAIGIAVKLAAPAALKDVSWPELLVGMPAVPIMLGAVFLQSILLAEGRTVLYNGIEVAVGLATVLLVAIVLPLAGGGVLLALSLLVGPQVLALFVYMSAMRGDGRILRPPNRALARRMIGYGARAYVVTLLGFLLIRVDLLLVNGIQGARAAGQYSIAVAAADALELLPSAVCINLFARLARGSADRELSVDVFHLIAVGYLIVCALAALLAGPAISLLFGQAYHPAIALLWWLLPGVYCIGLLNMIAYYFAAQGLPRELILVWIPGLAINLALDFALLPHHGTYVASLASSVAYALVLVLHLRLFARDLGSWSPLRPTIAGTSTIVRLALRRT
jgi:O-antigen/teichoic acid export membrane protein